MLTAFPLLLLLLIFILWRGKILDTIFPERVDLDPKRVIEKHRELEIEIRIREQDPSFWVEVKSPGGN